MAEHEILGGGGHPVDMVSGRPRRVTAAEEQKKQAQRRYREAMKKSLELAAKLQKGDPGFQIVVAKFRKRIRELIKEDRDCQLYATIIRAYQTDLEIAPTLAEEYLRQVGGPQLSPFIEEVPAAPEGIPAEA